MTGREQVRRSEDPEVLEQTEEAPSVSADTAEVDDLLDEIDTVLEENAEEFVRNYVQKGGE